HRAGGRAGSVAHGFAMARYLAGAGPRGAALPLGLGHHPAQPARVEESLKSAIATFAADFPAGLTPCISDSGDPRVSENRAAWPRVVPSRISRTESPARRRS